MTDLPDWDETVSVAAIALDDLMVEALVAGDLADDGDPALSLLAALRADVATGPGSDTAADAGLTVVPLRGPWRHRARRFSRGAVAASAAVMTVLSAGGVAAASVGATPGSVLYPVRKVLMGPVESPLDSVYRLLNGARDALDDGNPVAAQSKVTAARDQLQSIGVDAAQARADLSQLETAVAAAQPAPSTAAPAAGSAALPAAPPADAGTGDGAAGPATAPAPTTATTVDQGTQVDSQASPVPSATTGTDPSASPSPSPSATPSPSASASPTGSPSPAPTGQQQPRTVTSPSPGPAETPVAGG
jgi:hypothetical protein